MNPPFRFRSSYHIDKALFQGIPDSDQITESME